MTDAYEKMLALGTELEEAKNALVEAKDLLVKRRRNSRLRLS
jgi:hypothetical protein